MKFFHNRPLLRVVFLFLFLLSAPACIFNAPGDQITTKAPECMGSAEPLDLHAAQSIVDSAMGFYQASNEFWEQGELDSALGALDKSYALILEIEADSESDIYRQKKICGLRLPGGLSKCMPPG